MKTKILRNENRAVPRPGATRMRPQAGERLVSALMPVHVAHRHGEQRSGRIGRRAGLIGPSGRGTSSYGNAYPRPPAVVA
jgi:hypothetical protein